MLIESRSSDKISENTCPSTKTIGKGVSYFLATKKTLFSKNEVKCEKQFTLTMRQRKTEAYILWHIDALHYVYKK